jgi:hypothetical protein
LLSNSRPEQQIESGYPRCCEMSKRLAEVVQKCPTNKTIEAFNLPPLSLSPSDQIADEKALEDWNQRQR